MQRATPTNARWRISGFRRGPRAGRLRQPSSTSRFRSFRGCGAARTRRARGLRARSTRCSPRRSRRRLELERVSSNGSVRPLRGTRGREIRVPFGELAGQVTTFVEAALVATEPMATRDAELFASDDRVPGEPRLELTRRAAELALPPSDPSAPARDRCNRARHRRHSSRDPPLRRDAARIALQLLAHALPRARSAHAPLLLLRAGTAGSIESEEGRALLVEARAEKLGPARRRELALRHVAALAVRRGADFEETFRALAVRGAERARALDRGAHSPRRRART
jgi:hypothetical protein